MVGLGCRSRDPQPHHVAKSVEEAFCIRWQPPVPRRRSANSGLVRDRRAGFPAEYAFISNMTTNTLSAPYSLHQVQFVIAFVTASSFLSLFAAALFWAGGAT